MENKKKCSQCKNYLNYKCFTKDIRHTDGLQSSCTKCRSNYNRSLKDKYKALNLCSWCGKEKPRINRTTCLSCEEGRKLKNETYKILVFNHYGHKCVCCSESNKLFLTIDHINNDGKLHRQNVKTSMYRWVVKNNYPTDLQILCWNCNLGKYYNNGICPHNIKNEDILDNINTGAKK